MRVNEVALFSSGFFFGGGLDHMILALSGSAQSPLGHNVGVIGNWAFTAFDAGITALLYVLFQRLS